MNFKNVRSVDELITFSEEIDKYASEHTDVFAEYLGRAYSAGLELYNIHKKFSISVLKNPDATSDVRVYSESLGDKINTTLYSIKKAFEYLSGALANPSAFPLMEKALMGAGQEEDIKE